MESGRKPLFDQTQEPTKFQIKLPYHLVETLKINAIRARLPVSLYLHNLILNALGLPPGHPAAAPADTDGVVFYERRRAAIQKAKIIQERLTATGKPTKATAAPTAQKQVLVQKSGALAPVVPQKQPEAPYVPTEDDYKHSNLYELLGDIDDISDEEFSAFVSAQSRKNQRPLKNRRVVPTSALGTQKMGQALYYDLPKHVKSRRWKGAASSKEVEEQFNIFTYPDEPESETLATAFYVAKKNARERRLAGVKAAPTTVAPPQLQSASDKSTGADSKFDADAWLNEITGDNGSAIDVSAFGMREVNGLMVPIDTGLRKHKSGVAKKVKSARSVKDIVPAFAAFYKTKEEEDTVDDIKRAALLAVKSGVWQKHKEKLAAKRQAQAAPTTVAPTPPPPQKFVYVPGTILDLDDDDYID